MLFWLSSRESVDVAKPTSGPHQEAQTRIQYILNGHLTCDPAPPPIHTFRLLPAPWFFLLTDPSDIFFIKVFLVLSTKFINNSSLTRELFTYYY